jgi:hypothetical protein
VTGHWRETLVIERGKPSETLLQSVGGDDMFLARFELYDDGGARSRSGPPSPELAEPVRTGSETEPQCKH